MNASTEPSRRPVPGATVPNGWIVTAVPTVPRAARTSSWRRTVTATVPDDNGVDAVPGHWLAPGDVVAIPLGTLVLQADKTATGTAYTRIGAPYTTEDATVTVHRLEADGTATLLWGPKRYRNSSTAFGKTVVHVLTRLIEENPTPDGEPVVLAVAQRPNHRYTPACASRECGRPVAARAGHVVGHGKTAVVQHWPTCPGPHDPDPEQPRTPAGCDQCHYRGKGCRSHEAFDSNGIAGRVCQRCSREEPHCLSFA